MPDIYRNLLDLYETYSTLEIKDLALPTFGLLWILTLLWPLTDINRRDLATGASYVLYMMSAAVILFFVLPSEYINLDVTTSSQILTLLALGAVAFARWWLRKDLELQEKKLYEAPLPEEVSE